jgi:predicted protein tyrosine phosphatase
MENNMPWIENVAAADVPMRYHHEAGENSMLIQIMDPAPSWWPEPAHNFKETHRFEFLDAEDKDGFPDEAKISDQQAAEIVRLLQHALNQRMNVVVHCLAGLCRSGAVAEVGVMMGFQDAERTRIPNLRVKQKLMKQLGWTYDSNENPYDHENDWRNTKIGWER